MNKSWFSFIATVNIIDIMKNKKSILTIEKVETKNNLILDEDVLTLKEKVLNITKKNYRHTFIDIFNDLEIIKNENSKSVNNRIKNYSKNDDFKNTLDILEENITLYQHTKNVINFSISCTEDSPDVIKAIVILFALTHDFGKSKYILNDVIRNNSNIYSNTRHDIVSSYYLKKILIKNQNFDMLEKSHIEFLCNVLENQHSDSNVNNEILELFYKADSLAREYELNSINNKEEII
jgi:hypothetical protein